MAKELYDIRNYPRRSGTSQPSRDKPALHGKAVKLDERTIPDFIIFSQKLAKALKFYNLGNAVEGNWEMFLKSDVSYQLATLASTDTGQWAEAWRELLEKVEGPGGSPPGDDDHKKYFTWRFDFLYSVLHHLVEAYAHSSSLDGWRQDLDAVFHSTRLDVIYALLKSYFAASAHLVIDTGRFTHKDVTLLKKSEAEQRLAEYGKAVELLLSTPPLISDAGFIVGPASTTAEQVAAATEYLDELASQLLFIQSSLTTLGKKYLDHTLQHVDRHQPHVALFLAFLRLAETHQQQINGLLLKHLDFYYRQVLRIKPRPWQADETFVCFELSKNIDECFVEAGALLSAGKDPSGKDIFYKTTDDILVNKGALAEVRSFAFITGSAAPGNSPGIFADPAPHLLDRNGNPLAAGQSWRAFPATGQANPAYHIGLSFFSPLLHETPGEARRFALEIGFDQPVVSNSILTFFTNFASIKVLTEEHDQIIDILHPERLDEGRSIRLPFTISGKVKVSRTSPNASIIFGNKLESVEASFLDVIKLFQTARLVYLRIKLINHEVKVVRVDTTAGSTDLSSAFAAFGGVPKDGSSFSVVEPLLRDRQVSELSMSVEWDAIAERSYSVALSFPSQTAKAARINRGDEITQFPLIEEAPVTFTTDKIKVKLTGDLGHATYANDMTQAILAKSDPSSSLNQLKKFVTDPGPDPAFKPVSAGGISLESTSASIRLTKAIDDLIHGHTQLPSLPYTPMIKNITLTATIEERLIDRQNLNARQGEIFYQFPFGVKPLPHGNNMHLVPAFNIHETGDDAPASEGELYLGFKDLLPGQSLRLLIAVEEGSSDPALPEPQVSWTYLLDNAWRSFPEHLLHDGTGSLIRSGIVSVVLPDSDFSNNRLLPAGLFWLRASVPFSQVNAVSRITGIHTQAVSGRFENHDNDPAYAGTNVPAHTITNFSPKRAAIKKVTQPIASSGGRKNEEPGKLYTRSSERLRHKGRGISAFDYEHLILEAFPDIYKVKVLMHACPLKQSGTEIPKMLSRAGSVVILPVAKTTATAAAKPLLSKAKLEAVHRFIMTVVSPFAQVSVLNPVFEEVAIQIHVQFVESVKDRVFHEQLLHEALKTFLSPWAFDTGREPEFGGVIHRSAVVHFVEQLPYIHFITALALQHAGSPAGERVTATSPASILVSAEQHIVHGQLDRGAAGQPQRSSIAFC